MDRDEIKGRGPADGGKRRGVLRRLSRNKRSGERAGEWRGLIGDGFEMERKKRHFGGREEKVEKEAYGRAVEREPSVNNAQRMPRSCNSSHLSGPGVPVSCVRRAGPTEVIESGHENNRGNRLRVRWSGAQLGKQRFPHPRFKLKGKGKRRYEGAWRADSTRPLSQELQL